MHDVISTLGARTIIATTMQMDVMAAGNVSIEAECRITQQAWHAVSQ